MDRLRDCLEQLPPRFSKADLIKQQNKVSFELERMRWPVLNTNIPKYRTWCISYQCTLTQVLDLTLLIKNFREFLRTKLNF